MREYEQEQRFGREQRIEQGWNQKQGRLQRIGQDWKTKDSWAVENWMSQAEDMRSRWGTHLQDVLRRYDKAYQTERDELYDLRDQQKALLEEVREAPSSVEQQARMNYDRQLAQGAMLAAAQGRGVSGGDQALRDELANSSANIMNQTAAARADEYIQRLGMQDQLMGRQMGLSGQLSDMALRGAGLRQSLYGQDFEVGNKLALSTERALRNSATQGFDVGMGIDNAWQQGWDQMMRWRTKSLDDVMRVEKFGIDSNLAGQRLALDAWKANAGMGLAYDQFNEGNRQFHWGLDQKDMDRSLGAEQWNQKMSWAREMQEWEKFKHNQAWNKAISDQRWNWMGNVAATALPIAGGILGSVIPGVGTALGAGIGSLGGSLLSAGLGGGGGASPNLNYISGMMPSQMPGFGGSQGGGYGQPALGPSGGIQWQTPGGARANPRAAGYTVDSSSGVVSPPAAGGF